jgi:uncharacterized protein (DUF39 family)
MAKFQGMLLPLNLDCIVLDGEGMVTDCFPLHEVAGALSNSEIKKVTFRAVNPRHPIESFPATLVDVSSNSSFQLL